MTSSSNWCNAVASVTGRRPSRAASPARKQNTPQSLLTCFGYGAYLTGTSAVCSNHLGLELLSSCVLFISSTRYSRSSSRVSAIVSGLIKEGKESKMVKPRLNACVARRHATPRNQWPGQCTGTTTRSTSSSRFSPTAFTQYRETLSSSGFFRSLSSNSDWTT